MSGKQIPLGEEGAARRGLHKQNFFRAALKNADASLSIVFAGL